MTTDQRLARFFMVRWLYEEQGESASSSSETLDQLYRYLMMLMIRSKQCVEHVQRLPPEIFVNFHV